MKIFRKTKGCYGCKCCQLICGFHHTGAFDPSASSIHVQRDYVGGVITWSIDTTCDDCAGEPEPLCAQYCAYGIIGKVADDAPTADDKGGSAE